MDSNANAIFQTYKFFGIENGGADKGGTDIFKKASLGHNI